MFNRWITSFSTPPSTTLTLTYDIENRLISASGAKTATLVYDPLGRLFETSGGSADTTWFLYDGDALIAEYNSSNSLLRRYVHGAGVDEPLIWFEGSVLSQSARCFLHTDHPGSVIVFLRSLRLKDCPQANSAEDVIELIRKIEKAPIGLRTDDLRARLIMG